MKFNDPEIRQFRKELTDIITAFAASKGLHFGGLGNIGYDSINSSLGTGKLVFSDMAKQLSPDAPLESFISKRYRQGNREYRVTGVSASRPGHLNIVTNRGKVYIATPQQLSAMVCVG